MKETNSTAVRDIQILEKGILATCLATKNVLFYVCEWICRERAEGMLLENA